MAIITCSECGKKYSDQAGTCPFCVGKEKTTDDTPQNTFQFKQPPAQKPLPARKQPVIMPPNPNKIRLDCRACDSKKTMIAGSVPRFNGIIRMIGTIIVIPSLIGVAISMVGLLSTCMGSHEVMQSAEIAENAAASAGATIGAAIGFGVFLFTAAISLVSGLVGWLLLLTRKVYRCTVCGHFIDRA